MVEGFHAAGIAAGIKKGGTPDMALIVADAPAVGAGLLTTNQVKAAPVLVDRERLRGARFRAIIANSGNANACTGALGVADAREMARLTARALGVREGEVLVASTGVIGQRLPMAAVRQGVPRLVRRLSPLGLPEAASAIMTTDTFPKLAHASAVVGGRRVMVCGIAKGAGMIRPSMATMLAFILTDAQIRAPALRAALKHAVGASFNRITVDGDMSTNDTVIALASGRAGNPTDRGSLQAVARLLARVCRELALMIVRDGEGATKVITVEVRGARTEAEARRTAYAVAHSPLVKTAIFGQDANWGRILAAIGGTGVPVDPNRVEVAFDRTVLVRQGVQAGRAAEQRAAAALKRPALTITVDLHQGRAAAAVYTSDLTYEYVRINAGYRT
ncbi:MAG: bifunctional glutamate N-acetyltransferase/amino-acid acetyltransferase ArgJ [Deltaproteobacteria bacterium]|nr:bifunctional glutamate N-acetyltransferase/amino-acid acetyltransferase ArgJ [Deltaproteobacteria bacterium]MBI3076481.1 bifunctional glutamate N-acetyltransferase/amino-acid acetyltransferase ArgJ [Deltaproteobacteria bacterium]